MTKGYSVFLTVLFSLFLGLILLGHLVTPDTGFSQIENRYLQSLPALSIETGANGSFMTDFETYTTDQFPLRDLWVSTKAWCERLSGKQENNGVYFGSFHTLINRVDPFGQTSLEKAAEYLNTMHDGLDVPLYFGLIPSAAAIWADRLPQGAPTTDEQAVISDFYATLSVDTLPLSEALSQHSGEDIYYRTDHHWTSLGAYYGYTALTQAMGLTPVPLDHYERTTVARDFYGTIYSSSGVRWVPADQINTYVPAQQLSVTSYFAGTPEEGQLYVPESLSEKDKYTYFLGGVQPLCIIETELTDAPSVLIIRDSYSDCLAPFLTAHFSRIHLLDLRYYNMGIGSYVAEHDIDCVVVLYSLSNFVSDGNLFKLAL